MKAFIIFPNSFPIGGATTQRITHIASAFLESGVDCEMLIFKGTEDQNQIYNQELEGIYKNIRFRYIVDKTIWPRKKIRKILNYYTGLIRLLLILINELNKGDLVLLYADYSLVTNLALKLPLLVKRAKFIYAIDEYPWCIIHKEQYNKIYKWLYLSLYFKTFNGIITITQVLKNYYKKLSSDNCAFFHFPMSVDRDIFNELTKNKTEFDRLEYIAYAGGDIAGYDKDGVENIIDAFNLVKDKFPRLKLFLIGNFSQDRHIQVTNLALEDHIIFTGFIHYIQVLSFIKSAKLLIMAKIDNIQNRGCFSTKLGEYLLSGNPIVLTNIGEMKQYIKDDFNAYVSDSPDSKSLALKIEQVLENYPKAKIIGSNGYKTAMDKFDYRNHISSFKDYIDKLLKYN